MFCCSDRWCLCICYVVICCVVVVVCVLVFEFPGDGLDDWILDVEEVVAGLFLVGRFLDRFHPDGGISFGCAVITPVGGNVNVIVVCVVGYVLTDIIVGVIVVLISVVVISVIKSVIVMLLDIPEEEDGRLLSFELESGVSESDASD